MASGVVHHDDSESSLLVDDEWSQAAVVTAAGSSSPLRRLLHGGGKAMKRPAAATTAVKRFICSPFAAVFRTMSCARDDAISTCDDQQPRNNLREMRKKRPSLEQLLRMEAPPPPLPSDRPDHRHQRKLGSTPRDAAAAVAPYKVVVSSCAAAAVKEKPQQEPRPPFPSPQQAGHFVAAAVSDERRTTTIVPVNVKVEAGGGGPGGRQTNARRLVVVFASSLRACSRAPRINDGKLVVAAGGGRAPGKAELFYYRPIPMGRRCRVQHLEESPYGASCDLSSLLDIAQM